MVEWLATTLGMSYTTVVVALGAAVLGVASGALGAFAVLRQRSLMGDALAHSALPGVAFAFLITGEKDPVVLLAGAGLVGILGAFMMVGMEQLPRITSDVAIGVVLSTFFALGIVLLTHIAHSGNSNQAGLERYLFGQAAGLVVGDVQLMAAVSGIAILAVIATFRPLKTTLFDPRFAGSIGLRVRFFEILMTALLVVAILVGLRTVGAILMVAMLIVPTATARQVTSRLAVLVPVACVVGAGVGMSGALLSTSAALPTGPVIALTGLAVVLAAVIFAPGRGILWNARKIQQRRRRRADENTLLSIGRAPAGVSVRELDSRSLGRLARRGLAREYQSTASITQAGERAYAQLVARRDLWSLWLEHGWRVELDDARDPTPETMDEVLGERGVATLRSLGGRGVA